jgi:hypothetical protein
MFKSDLLGRWFAVAVTCLFFGCASEEGMKVGDVTPEDEWWNNPGLIQDHMAAIGVSPLLNARAEGPARTYAETDGRAKMAAVLKSRMNQLVENWSKDVGDLTKEASFSSFVNNEALTRQFVDADIAGAVPYKYHKAEGNLYVLMVLKNPEQWVANLANGVRDSALQDETLFKTEVLKNDFRDKMDKLRTEQTDKTKAQQDAFLNQVNKK